jgi:hypothetical protein
MNVQDYWPYSYPQEWFDLVSKLNIHQRIHGAMADIQPLEKTKKDGIKFAFHGHEAVTATVKGLAEKWRFCVESTVLEHKFEVTEIYGKPRMLCILHVAVRFINIDNPLESTEILSIGYGVDESDKGPGKALSYAVKMALLKTFLVYDGEKLDNEAYCYQHEREEKQLKQDKEQYDKAKKEWGALVKALSLDVKEEAARLKREYGDPPTLEGIQIDCDEMQAEIDKAAKTKNDKLNERPKGLHPSVIHSSELRHTAEDEYENNKGNKGPVFGED